MWQAESVERTPRRCRWQEQNSRETLGLSLQLKENVALYACSRMLSRAQLRAVLLNNPFYSD